MTRKLLEHRKLYYHPMLSIRELESQLPEGARLSPLAKRSIVGKIKAFSVGTARRNKDYKCLIGFSEHGLFELRWDLPLGDESRKVRLIGANLDRTATLLLLWHVKNPMMTSEDQRILMNLACDKAIERKASIDIHNLRT